jgi:hypothetical protein
MKKILLCLFLIISSKNFAQYSLDETDSNVLRLKKIAVNMFIKVANDPTTKTYKKIQEIFDEVRNNGRTQSKEDYTNKIDKRLIKTSFVDFELYWELGSPPADTGYDGRSRAQDLTIFLSIPYYDGIAMGYGINTITFLVTLEQTDRWKGEETDEVPPEKCRGYKVNYKLTEIKFIDTD